MSKANPHNTPQHPWYILGAGAIGSLWATYGFQSGADIRLILRDQKAVNDYLQHGGIHLSIEGKALICTAPAECPSSLATPIKYLLITTKAQQTLDALNSIKPHISDHAVLLLLQNGLGIVEHIRQAFPLATILQGSTTEGCYRQSAYEFVHAGHGHTYIGNASQDHLQDHTRLAEIANTLSFPPLAISISDNIDEILWRKLAVNCAINPMTVIYNCRNGELLTNPKSRNHMTEVVNEIINVSTAMNRDPWLTGLHELVIDVATSTAQNRSSMLQDVQAGRRTEIDAITGYLCQLAKKYGVDVPINQQILSEINRISALDKC